MPLESESHVSCKRLHTGMGLTLLLAGVFLALPVDVQGDMATQDRRIAIEVLSQRGRDFARLQDWGKSAAAYTEALRRDPENPDLLFGQGYAFYGQKDLPGAVQSFRKALKYDSRHSSSTLWMGLALLEDRALDKAEMAFQRLLEGENTDPRAYFGLGSIHAARYRKQDSAQEKQLALKYLEQYLQAARLSQGIGAEYRQQAEALLLDLRYGEEGRLYNQALASYGRGEYDQCRLLLDKALKLDPQFQKAHYLKGVLCNTRGSSLFEADFTNCIKALRMAPDEPEARCLLGSIYRLLGKDDLARANLEAAARLDPGSQKALNLLGALYHESGDREKTALTYQRSRDVNPHSDEGRAAGLELDVLQGTARGPLVFVRDPQEEQGRIEAQGIVEDAYLTGRLHRILERTVQRNRFPYLWEKYEIKIINNPGIQACSLPGGRIYINIGLLQHVKDEFQDSEDVLAFIIAHEMAHVERDHVIDTVRHAEALGRRVEGLPRVRMILTEFHRSDEFEADRLGARYTYVAGYDPNAGMRFLKGMVRGGDYLDDQGAAILEERLQRFQHCLKDLRTFEQSFEQGLDRLAREDHRGARACFEHFLSAFPGDPSARNNLAVAFHKQALCCQGPAHWWKASEIEPLRLRAIQRVRRSEEGRCGRAWCEGMAEQAERQFKILLAANPGNEIALDNLANLYQDLGKSSEAKALYEKALSLNPDYAEARNNYAVLLCLGKEYRAGIQELESAILAQPTCLPPHYNLGKAYYELGNHAAAARAWERYLELDKSRSGWVQRAERHAAEARNGFGRSRADDPE